MKALPRLGPVAGSPRFWVPVACAVTLLVGYLLKANCDYGRGSTYPPLCYSDLVGIYEGRGLAEALPYVDFPKGGTFRDPGFLEYPVGIGAVVLGAASFTHGRESFFRANAFVLAVAGMVSAILLMRMAGWRALWWALAPALLLYAFLNWDLLAVLCAVAGCFMVQRGRTTWAGAWFGAGAAVKLYPALFLVALVLERVLGRHFRGAMLALTAGVMAFVIPNVALAAVNADAWLATYAFHAVRGADLSSVWGSLLPDASPRMVNALSAGALLVSALSLVIAGWWRMRRHGSFPTLAVGSALIATFLLTSKVASPQYALWILPSFVFLNVGVSWWLAWNAVAVLVHAALFGVGIAGYEPAMAPTFIKGASLLRTIFLLAVSVAFVTAAEVSAVADQSLPRGRDDHRD